MSVNKKKTVGYSIKHVFDWCILISDYTNKYKIKLKNLYFIITL